MNLEDLMRRGFEEGILAKLPDMNPLVYEWADGRYVYRKTQMLWAVYARGYRDGGAYAIDVVTKIVKEG
jgi:hypothetical protein